MNNAYSDKKGRYPVKTVRLEDCDQTVFDFFDKALSLEVDAPQGRRKVSILWSTGERWKLMKASKFRDANGVLILPILSIRRTNIDRMPGFGGLGQEVPSVTIRKEIHPKTGNMQNLVTQRKLNGFPETKSEPIYSVTTIPYPDFCTLGYTIEVWCQYESNANEILEKIFQKNEYKRTSSFVMPMEYSGVLPKGDSYYLVGFLDGNVTPQSNSEDLTDQERMIKYTYSIKVPVYLILDPEDSVLSYGKDRENKDSTGKAIVYEEQSVNKIKLSEEILTLEEFQKLFG